MILMKDDAHKKGKNVIHGDKRLRPCSPTLLGFIYADENLNKDHLLSVTVMNIAECSLFPKQEEWSKYDMIKVTPGISFKHGGNVLYATSDAWNFF